MGWEDCLPEFFMASVRKESLPAKDAGELSGGKYPGLDACIGPMAEVVRRMSPKRNLRARRKESRVAQTGKDSLHKEKDLREEHTVIGYVKN